MIPELDFTEAAHPFDVVRSYRGATVLRPMEALLTELHYARRTDGSCSCAALYESAGGSFWSKSVLDLDYCRGLPLVATWKVGEDERKTATSLVELADRAAADPYGYQPPDHVEPDYEELGVGLPLAFEALAYTRGRLGRRGRLQKAVVHVWDYRGSSVALFDERPSNVKPGVSFGVELAQLAVGTVLSGPRRRRDVALRRVSGLKPQTNAQASDLARPFIAGGVAEYLASDEVLQDGGVPPIGFTDVRLVDGVRLEDAPHPGWVDEAAQRGTDRRRRQLREMALRQLNEHAFGHGFHSPRGRHTRVRSSGVPELEAPQDGGDPVLELIWAERQADAEGALSSLRARLDSHGRALLDARRASPDSNLPEIARLNNWRTEDVRPVWRRVRYALDHL